MGSIIRCIRIGVVICMSMAAACGGSNSVGSVFDAASGYNYNAERIIFDDGSTLAQRLSGTDIAESFLDRLLLVSKAYADTDGYIRASDVYFDDGSGGRSVQSVLETIIASIPLDVSSNIIGTWTADSKNYYYNGITVTFNADGTYTPSVPDDYRYPGREVSSTSGVTSSRVSTFNVGSFVKLAQSEEDGLCEANYRFSVIGNRYLTYEYNEAVWNQGCPLKQMGSNIIMIDRDHMILETVGYPMYLNRVAQ